jgi:large subunit ribosomal protein L23
MKKRMVIKSPLITEKATFVSEKAGQVVFMVDAAASKHDIRRAVEELFEVEVEAVRTVNYLGKVRKRFGRAVGRNTVWKKAYVTLAEGQQVDLLEKV